MHFVVACPSETVHLHHLLCVCDTCVLCAAHDGTYNQWTPGGPWYYYAMGYGTCKQGQDKCHAPCGYGYSWIGVWKSDTMVSAFFLSFAHIIFQCSNLSTDVDEAKLACNAPLCPRPARSRVLAPPAPYSVCFCVSYTGIYVIRQPRYADLFSCTSQANNTWSLVREARDDSWSV